MCVMSAVIGQGISTLPWYPNNDFELQSLKLRVQALEEAMKAAAIVDKYTNQPECEDALKKKELEEHAKRLGITISFV